MIGVNAIHGRAARHALDPRADHGHAGGAADGKDSVDVCPREAGVGEDALGKLPGPLQQAALTASNSARVTVYVAVLRPSVTRISASCSADSARLSSLDLDEQCAGVPVEQVPVRIGEESPLQVVRYPVVPVPAAESWSPVAAITSSEPAQLHERHVEGAASEVVDQEPASPGTGTQPVGESGGGRLADDPKDLQARLGAASYRGRALRVREVLRNGDHGPADRLSECALGRAFRWASTSADRAVAVHSRPSR